MQISNFMKVRNEKTKQVSTQHASNIIQMVNHSTYYKHNPKGLALKKLEDYQETWQIGIKKSPKE